MNTRGREGGVIALAALLGHGPALFGAPPPVDRAFLEANALLRLPPGEFLSGLLSRRYFELTGEATYQPAVTLLHYLAGGAPALFHGLVLAAHALCAWLLCEVAKRLGQSAKTALIAGVLLAVFPPATEAVGVPSFAGHVFGLAAALACVLCGLFYLEGGKHRQRWLAGGAAAFAAGCLCKETVVVAPALLVLCWACDARPAPWRRAARLFAGLGALAAVYLGWRFLALPPAPGIPAPYRADWLLSLGWYARMLLWPWPLCFEHASLGPGLVFFAGLFVFAGAAVCLRPPLLLCWAWILLELLPYLHLVPFAHTSPVADRYLYFPAAGFCLLLGTALDSRRGRGALWALAMAWGAMSFWRSALFIDRAGLCEQTGACAPASVPAQLMLGNSQLERGLNDQAKASFERALALDPRSAVAWSNLGIAQYGLGEREAAVADFQKSLTIVDSPEVRGNLATALEGMKKPATSPRAPKRRAKTGLP